MRFTTIILLAVLLFIGCESPLETNPDQIFYQGQIVQNERAPFLLEGNSLAKDSDGILVIDETVSAGTVYGQSADPEVYAATGGEVLPEDTWVDNISAEPIAADVTAKLTVTFEQLAEVTVIDAVDMSYIDAAGKSITFSGTGVITAFQIKTGPNGSVKFICNTKFSIGGDGGDWG
ncbi:MAG: hypothetical protein HQ507_06075 [Candidatus Marinimicrobia bacterium]|nr:hypothetical protein [Candidatus Neomarinimicrobiota bacterium]